LSSLVRSRRLGFSAHSLFHHAAPLSANLVRPRHAGDGAGAPRPSRVLVGARTRHGVTARGGGDHERLGGRSRSGSALDRPDRPAGAPLRSLPRARRGQPGGAPGPAGALPGAGGRGQHRCRRTQARGSGAPGERGAPPSPPRFGHDRNRLLRSGGGEGGERRFPAAHGIHASDARCGRLPLARNRTRSPLSR